MQIRKLIGGTLAALFLTGSAWSAGSDRLQVPMPDLPGVFSSPSDDNVVRLAQANDPRVTALEEQVRSLAGTIEELNFQILQMQEQLRKMQEDNEFRFQELEQKRTDAGADTTRKAQTEVEVPGTTTPSTADTGQQQQLPATSGDQQSADTTAATGATTGAATGTQAGEQDAVGGTRTFGTITFDADGNVTGGTVGDQAVMAPSVEDGAAAGTETQVAALPSTDDPEELYRNSYEFILSGDYRTAEAGFRQHVSRFPDNERTADAHFWLGESLLGQKKYNDAAEVFLESSKAYPESTKAPDMLLKLGVSLAGLNQREMACATFSEVTKRYPNASEALKERLGKERQTASC